MKYYVYMHIDPIRGHPFLVGKGSGNRAWSFKNRHKNYGGRYTYIFNAGMYPIVLIIEENLTEEAAFISEMFWIKYYGRVLDNTGPLLNLSTGGDGGASGRRVSEEERKRMGDASRKRWANPEWSAKTGEAIRKSRINTTWKPSDKQNLDVAERNRVRRNDPVQREDWATKVKASWTPEKRQAQSELKTLQQSSPEYRAAQGERSRKAWATRKGL